MNQTENLVKQQNVKKKEEIVNKGITLIALVITIIVLLILAGVTIATLTGQNGILTNATKSKEENEKGNELDLVKLAASASLTDSLGQPITLSNLQNNLDKQSSNATVRQDGSGFIVKFNDSGREYKVDQYARVEEEIGEEGGGTGSLPSTGDTIPFLPDGFTQKEETNLDNGLTITNGTNSYVWVEVPKNIYTTAISETDYSNIEADMKTYTANYKSSTYEDVYHSDEVTGLTQIEYNNLKQAMLTSVYQNGGFWISQYEIGTETIRSSKTDPITATPKSQEGLYQYNWVTCSQAQELAERMNPNSNKYKSSLLFGVQWDLTCKFLETKGTNLGATAEERQNAIKTNSTAWGNYYNAIFDIIKGKYSIDYGKSYTEVSGSYTKPDKSIVLTTGATERNSSMNIYDFAGNEREWTLERASLASRLCSHRGGYYLRQWGELSSQQP